MSYVSESESLMYDKWIEDFIVKEMLEIDIKEIAKKWFPKPEIWSQEMRYTTRPQSGVQPVFNEADFKEFVKKEYLETQNKLDESGDMAPCYVLVDNNGYIVPWRLIASKNGPCWQNIKDPSQFQSAFEDTAVTKLGHKEVVIVAQASAVMKDGNLLVRPSLPYGIKASIEKGEYGGNLSG